MSLIMMLICILGVLDLVFRDGKIVKLVLVATYGLWQGFKKGLK